MGLNNCHLEVETLGRIPRMGRRLTFVRLLRPDYEVVLLLSPLWSVTVSDVGVLGDYVQQNTLVQRPPYP